MAKSKIKTKLFSTDNPSKLHISIDAFVTSDAVKEVVTLSVWNISFENHAILIYK